MNTKTHRTYGIKALGFLTLLLGFALEGEKLLDSLLILIVGGLK